MRERNGTHHELGVDYARVLLSDQLNRVVACRDQRQWIIQAFRGGQWRNLTFHVTRASLVRDWHRATGEAAPERFAGFPERFRRGCPPYLTTSQQDQTVSSHSSQEASHDD